MVSTSWSSIFLGSDSLLVECARTWLAKGHRISAVVTDSPRIAEWAQQQGLPTVAQEHDLPHVLGDQSIDYLFAITYLKRISTQTLDLGKRGAINFHDGPLPRYGGLNAPVWALLNGEQEHGITWHLMENEIDAGDILHQQTFALNADETALSLNTRCFALAIETFGPLVDSLAQGTVSRRPQDTTQRQYFSRYSVAPSAAVIDWRKTADEITRLVRALDFGPRYGNPIGLPTIAAGPETLAVSAATVLNADAAPAAEATASPGTIVAATEQSLHIACGQGSMLALTRVVNEAGVPLSPTEALSRLGRTVGQALDLPSAALCDRLQGLASRWSRRENYWVKRLTSLQVGSLPYADGPSVSSTNPSPLHTRPLQIAAEFAAAYPTNSALACAFGLLIARLNGADAIHVACSDLELTSRHGDLTPWIAPTVPLLIKAEGAERFQDVVTRFDQERAKLDEKGGFLRNLGARYPALHGSSQLATPGLLPIGIAYGDAAAPAGTVLQLLFGQTGPALRYNPNYVSEATAIRFESELTTFLKNLSETSEAPAQQVPLFADATVPSQQGPDIGLPPNALIHRQFEAQVDRTPEATALVSGDTQLTYRDLEQQANRLAHLLRSLGVGPDTLVGVSLPRSADLVVATLAVLKAGGAYVPLDPTYPAQRLALVIEDSALQLLITEQRIKDVLPGGDFQCVLMDTLELALATQPAERPTVDQSWDSLAYIIYTSGSTGKPKGVMVEHRQVINFFAGMTDRIPHRTGDVWLAVTSLSFDISVLELFWTLQHGFKVVLHSGESQTLSAGQQEPLTANRPPLDFSLFYFAADAKAQGSERYRLLMDGARFADENGFKAVWTPERHFHAFGGLYPNPAVTGAAVAAITKRVGIRAGSVVLPLHHPVRVAEGWSVVDNLSDGRVGISVAAGWQPDDFILMPNNYRQAKAVMMRDLEVVRKLWRGESVEFEGPNGSPVTVKIQPEPIQPELPVWVTTAGSEETFKLAGAAGANLLTHLLGQTVEQLAPKIAAYRKARAEAGFDPDAGVVSLMLHSFVAPDREQARNLVRGPLKAYLGTSMDLIKDKAWVFPAFQRPKGMQGDRLPGGAELAQLNDEERDAILEAAFERYFATSGLFGTVNDALQTVERVNAIGVNEIACLIDFGIDTQVVLDHLPHLDAVQKGQPAALNDERAARRSDVVPKQEAKPQSLLELVESHGITHLQCTPSMARMFLDHPESRTALGRIQHMFLGGEALNPELLATLRSNGTESITNLYGPTETTVWSSSHRIQPSEAEAALGTAIANTRLYILDEKRRPLPNDVPGELYIAGLGVTRGYHQRPDLNAQCFPPDPFVDEPGARMYKTGDRAVLSKDGLLRFLGRVDYQIKVRGHRIDPGEIESVMRAMPEISDCVVLLREDVPGDQRLVAYVVTQTSQQDFASATRESLKTQLPSYMVPAHVVPLSTLPLTPNRKIDRKALPAPTGRADHTQREQASNATQLTIATIWQELLGQEAIGIDDNFFDIGGHSLLVVRAHRMLAEKVETPLSLTDLYRFPTIRTLAEFLSSGDSGTARKGSQRGKQRRGMLRRQARSM